ncbi:alpha/beta fold hydrolase [soil metagenome]
MASPWFVRREPRPAASTRLFCFPYAGAGASVFRAWSSGLPPHIEAVAVQLPGRETRLHEPAVPSLEATLDSLAEEMKPWLDRPYAFFGHGMGGLIAFELARRLTATGSGPVALVTGARRAPRLNAAAASLNGLEDADFMVEIQRRRGGIPESVPPHRNLLEPLLPTLRADMAAQEAYRYAAGPPLDCSVVALGGTTDARVHARDLTPWVLETRGAFSWNLIHGGHFFLHTAPAQVLGCIVRSLHPLQRRRVTSHAAHRLYPFR